MLNSGKNFALRDKKTKYSNSRVVRKKILNETKNHNPPHPFKLNGSVPKLFNQYVFIYQHSHLLFSYFRYDVVLCITYFSHEVMFFS